MEEDFDTWVVHEDWVEWNEQRTVDASVPGCEHGEEEQTVCLAERVSADESDGAEEVEEAVVVELLQVALLELMMNR